MVGYMATPKSTVSAHYALENKEFWVDDRKNYLKKTDFSDYTEVKLKLMKHLNTGRI